MAGLHLYALATSMAGELAMLTILLVEGWTESKKTFFPGMEFGGGRKTPHIQVPVANYQVHKEQFSSFPVSMILQQVNRGYDHSNGNNNTTQHRPC